MANSKAKDSLQDPRAFTTKNLKDIDDEKLKGHISGTKADLLLRILDDGISASERDPSIYTGISGIALTLHKIGQKDLAISLLEKAKKMEHKKGEKSKSVRISFLCGMSGPLALLAVFKKSELDLKSLLKLEDIYLRTMPDMPDELLYGRVGYLYALLYVKEAFPDHADLEKSIQRVVNIIIKSGQDGSDRMQSRCPLMYEWHNKKYYGAAHGITGILFVLLQAGEKYITEDIMKNYIKASIDYLKSKMYTSGNVPSSHGSENDKLIHWCHGAPGAIHLFLLSSQIFESKEYLEAAKRCSDVIWKRGLLKKGYGLCHGVSGNAYAFLAMYEKTRDARYLQKAKRFCNFACDYGSSGCSTPDRPYSLFEGMSGTVYFLDDMEKILENAEENIKEAYFPCFYVSGYFKE